jgi:hypothetical protein
MSDYVSHRANDEVAHCKNGTIEVWAGGAEGEGSVAIRG